MENIGIGFEVKTFYSNTKMLFAFFILVLKSLTEATWPDLWYGRRVTAETNKGIQLSEIKPGRKGIRENGQEGHSSHWS